MGGLNELLCMNGKVEEETTSFWLSTQTVAGWVDDLLTFRMPFARALR